jgi:hypothetical protein
MKTITDEHKPFLIWLLNNIDTYKSDGYFIRKALSGERYDSYSHMADVLNEYRLNYIDEYSMFLEFHKIMKTIKI